MATSPEGVQLQMQPATAPVMVAAPAQPVMMMAPAQPDPNAAAMAAMVAQQQQMMQMMMMQQMQNQANSGGQVAPAQGGQGQGGMSLEVAQTLANGPQRQAMTGVAGVQAKDGELQFKKAATTVFEHGYGCCICCPVKVDRMVVQSTNVDLEHRVGLCGICCCAYSTKESFNYRVREINDISLSESALPCCPSYLSFKGRSGKQHHVNLGPKIRDAQTALKAIVDNLEDRRGLNGSGTGGL